MAVKFSTHVLLVKQFHSLNCYMVYQRKRPALLCEVLIMYSVYSPICLSNYQTNPITRYLHNWQLFGKVRNPCPQ